MDNKLFLTIDEAVEVTDRSHQKLRFCWESMTTLAQAIKFSVTG